MVSKNKNIYIFLSIFYVLSLIIPMNFQTEFNFLLISELYYMGNQSGVFKIVLNVFDLINLILYLLLVVFSFFDKSYIRKVLLSLGVINNVIGISVTFWSFYNDFAGTAYSQYYMKTLYDQNALYFLFISLFFFVFFFIVEVVRDIDTKWLIEIMLIVFSFILLVLPKYEYIVSYYFSGDSQQAACNDCISINDSIRISLIFNFFPNIEHIILFIGSILFYFGDQKEKLNLKKSGIILVIIAAVLVFAFNVAMLCARADFLDVTGTYYFYKRSELLFTILFLVTIFYIIFKIFNFNEVFKKKGTKNS